MQDSLQPCHPSLSSISCNIASRRDSSPSPAAASFASAHTLGTHTGPVEAREGGGWWG
jgi:hypothetical protein